jgi:hypothetical protein
VSDLAPLGVIPQDDSENADKPLALPQQPKPRAQAQQPLKRAVVRAQLGLGGGGPITGVPISGCLNSGGLPSGGPITGVPISGCLNSGGLPSGGPSSGVGKRVRMRADEVRVQNETLATLNRFSIYNSMQKISLHDFIRAAPSLSAEDLFGRLQADMSFEGLKRMDFDRFSREVMEARKVAKRRCKFLCVCSMSPCDPAAFLIRAGSDCRER